MLTAKVRMKRTTIILALVAICISTRGQNFTNLNFEAAYNLPGNPGFNGTSISVAYAMPGWTAYDGIPGGGGGALFSIYYVSNSFPGDSTAVELDGGSLALSGNNLSVGLYDDGYISQTGTVPVNAASLEFDVSSSANLHVTLGGQGLSYSEISGGPDYTVYGANIPVDMEGQTEALTFYMDGGETLLDDIEFQPIPEPSEYGLMGVGLVVFGFWRRRKR
jgi:PEP-CTERM motif